MILNSVSGIVGEDHSLSVQIGYWATSLDATLSIAIEHGNRRLGSCFGGFLLWANPHVFRGPELAEAV